VAQHTIAFRGNGWQVFLRLVGSPRYKPSMKPTRSFRRAVIVIVLVLLALSLDAATGFNLMAAGGCITYFVVRFFAMTAGSVLAVIGLVAWLFSRFQSRQALNLITVALALAIAALLFNQAVAWIGVGCGD
jgi:asparagine N-glycosylation enzyme membrane subunit Stt3